MKNSLGHVKLHRIFRDPWLFLACGFGVGVIPWAPGTMGTVLGIGLYLCLYKLPFFVYLFLTVTLFFLSLLICHKAYRRLGGDHPAIILDEVIGVLFALCPTWFTFTSDEFGFYPYIHIVLIFCLFRLFDIWKPYPIKRIEVKFPNGFGVVIDDVIAGFFAWFWSWPLGILISVIVCGFVP